MKIFFNQTNNKLVKEFRTFSMYTKCNRIIKSDIIVGLFKHFKKMKKCSCLTLSNNSIQNKKKNVPRYF